MIKIKEKPCKGSGKAKGYGCNKPTLYRKYGLCNSCYRDFLINSEPGKEILSKAIIRGKKKVEKEKKKSNIEFKLKNKSIRKLILEARIPFQKYIRLRDINNACISCGSTESKIWDAGHFKKAELYTGLIFDERNVRKQCRKCNTYLNGNEGEYRKQLIEMFGQKWVDILDEDANKLRTYKFTREELINIKKKYTQKIKDFKLT